jgi:hypothetical protein
MSYHRDFDSYDVENESVAINRPTGANLIEGTLTEVILFLDKLSSIEGYSNGKERWRNIIERANGGHVLKEDKKL